MTNLLHEKIIVIDGLIISKFDRSIFEAMHAGGITAANCTCSIWENFYDSMKNIAEFKKQFDQNSDLIIQVFTTADIARAKREGKTGIILGWQNLSGIEDQISFLKLFKDLGVGVMQIAYNTQNFIGSGCYEKNDSGLSDFGHEVIDEMNRVGILCDLSHVGPKTSHDVILASKKPVAYTHCLPAGLKEHPRNKSDEQLRFIANHDGFVGVTMFPPFLKKGVNSTIVDYIEAINYVIDVVGEDQVGIGTDFTQGYKKPFFDWITQDKGYARKLTEFGEIEQLEGIAEISQFPNITHTMEKMGWKENRIRKIMGDNWVNLLKEVWGA